MECWGKLQTCGSLLLAEQIEVLKRLNLIVADIMRNFNAMNVAGVEMYHPKCCND
jgi:hypothetical protein